MSEPASLLPIRFWEARSFWLLVARVFLPIFTWATGIVVIPDDLADYAMAVVGLYLVLEARGYFERANPQRRVVARLPKETTP